MRDRRNTNLSISSASLSSANNSPVVPDHTDDVEKGRFLWLPPQTIDAGLPSPLIKHAQETKKPSLYQRLQLKVTIKHLVAITGLFLLYIGYRGLHIDSYITLGSARSYEVADGTSPADIPLGPVVIRDDKGQKRWTMNIPDQFAFPLRPNQYTEMCKSSDEVSKTVKEMAKKESKLLGNVHYTGHSRAFTAVDRTFLDIDEAMDAGLLVTSDEKAPISTVGRRNGTGQEGSVLPPVCDRSLTFVMASDNAGFGHSLLALWLSYAMAKKDRRAFFLDDTRWQYGDYLSYFPTPPQPLCSPPPARFILPCPHHARHLVVSAATMPWAFGDKLDQHISHHKRHVVRKQREIFRLLRTGFEDLFALQGDDAKFMEERVNGLRSSASLNGQPVIGMHIRRGDRHPFEFEFSNDYLPFERFTSAVLDIVQVPSESDVHNSSAPHVPVLVSSDDPDIPSSPDLNATFPASASVELQRVQDRIVLASKRTLSPSVPLRNGAYVKHVDENSGWEGGFFASLFESLGRPKKITHASFHSAKEFRDEIEANLVKHKQNGDAEMNEEEKAAQAQAVTLKQLVGRAYLLDMAILSKSDKVVCAVSSASCRVLGVMMGWQKVKDGDWINVDDGRLWSWDGSR